MKASKPARKVAAKRPVASLPPLRLSPADKAELEARAVEEQGELTPFEEVIEEAEQIARGHFVVRVEPAPSAK